MSAILAVLANPGPSGHTLDVTITTPGSGTYSPPDWLIGLEATIQCWGSGADGSDKGGGGGAFAQANWTFTGDVDYVVATGNDAAATSWNLGITDTPLAPSASGSSGGTGGTGDVTYDGGNGGSAGSAGGGGGGGAASPDGGGSNGDNGDPDGSGAGGLSGDGIGHGGDGQAVTGDDGVGVGTGGGGGLVAGGAGQNGQIRIIYPAI